MGVPVSGRVHRDFRRQANQVARQTVDAVAPAINQTIGNELLTRQRVEALESLRERRLLGRLRWLLTGR